MYRFLNGQSRVWFAMAVCSMALALQSCTSVEPDLVKQEDGYLYGYGKGGSPEEAELEAKRDLIANALESSMRKRSGESRRIIVTGETARGISLEAKRVAELEEETSASVTLRVREEDWESYEAGREAALRKELAPALARLSGARPGAGSAEEAVSALSKLETAGVDGLLTVEEGGTGLLSDAIADQLARLADSVSVSLVPADGLLRAGQAVTVRLTDAGGNPITGIPLEARWSLGGEPVGELPQSGRTDGQGTAGFQVPAGGESPAVSLRVTAAFAGLADADARQTAVRLSSIDKQLSVEATYVLDESLANRFGSFIRVEAGTFEMGAVPGDKRAPKREAARSAETGTYEIAAHPVTNAQYRLFLDATGYEKAPEFFDNPDYTVPDQPVVGITRTDAEAFAAWLSGVTERIVRLPTEAEWEKAAKAGRTVAFPWGDENPADGSRANFRGNGRFNRPSPVGSCPDGANPWGLHDMAGNVWELVATLPEEPQIAKGGSWMEGPNDVRISNRRELDSAKTYADVGFRVVMEENK